MDTRFTNQHRSKWMNFQKSRAPKIHHVWTVQLNSEGVYVFLTVGRVFALFQNSDGYDWLSSQSSKAVNKANINIEYLEIRYYGDTWILVLWPVTLWKTRTCLSPAVSTYSPAASNNTFVIEPARKNSLVQPSIRILGSRARYEFFCESAFAWGDYKICSFIDESLLNNDDLQIVDLQIL